MWGTIARMQVRPDVPQAYLLAQMNAFNHNRLTGMVNVCIYQSASDPREIWMVAMFDDEDAYRQNAESRVQHAEYLTLRACLESDPDWHDVGELISEPGDRPA